MRIAPIGKGKCVNRRRREPLRPAVAHTMCGYRGIRRDQICSHLPGAIGLCMGRRWALVVGGGVAGSCLGRGRGAVVREPPVSYHDEAGGGWARVVATVTATFGMPKGARAGRPTAGQSGAGSLLCRLCRRADHIGGNGARPRLPVRESLRVCEARVDCHQCGI